MDETLFHESTSSSLHPPSILKPFDVISSPDGDDLDVVVSSPASLTLIESSKSVIPSPAPIFNSTSPGPVDEIERPDPAVIDVITYEPALIESIKVPDLPASKLSSDVDAKIPFRTLSSDVEASIPDSTLSSDVEASIPFRTFSSLVDESIPSNTLSSVARAVTSVPDKYKV